MLALHTKRESRGREAFPSHELLIDLTLSG
jgi:hypothetical protein